MGITQNPEHPRNDSLLIVKLTVARSGDWVDIDYKYYGNGLFQIHEIIEEFGDGNGHARARQKDGNVAMDIRESGDEVLIERDGDVAHTGVGGDFVRPELVE